MDPLNERPALCPVCGFMLGQPAWTDAGPSDEICPSCGIQFGYDDAAGGDLARRQQVYENWRRRWVAKGMAWHSVGVQAPGGWNPEEQLRKLREEGRQGD